MYRVDEVSQDLTRTADSYVLPLTFIGRQSVGRHRGVKGQSSSSGPSFHEDEGNLTRH